MNTNTNEETVERIGAPTGDVARTLVIVPQRGAQEYDIAVGTSVAEVSQHLELDGAGSLPAYDEMSNPMQPGDAVTQQTGALNFAFKLAGA